MKKNCKQCKKEFKTERQKSKFCSHFCYGESLKGKPSWNKNIPCKESTKEKIRIKRAQQVMGPCSDETKRKISITETGKIVSDETRKKISIKNTGRVSPRKGTTCSNETKEKISKSKKGKFLNYKHTEQTRKNMSVAQQKVVAEGRNPNYKGGITPINKKIRMSLEWKLWREEIFRLDDFTCQKYGTKGGKLHPHHIQNFSDFPEIRFSINNGITLSVKAHQEFHKKYGFKNNTREQLEEFIGRKFIRKII